jgi:uncharacterized membrane protein YedE/YeeE
MSISHNQWRPVVAAACGVIFGVGLAVAQMTNPNKVLNFLDVLGTWDASLLLVLGAATGCFAIAFQRIGAGAKPVLDEEFHLPRPRSIDAGLVVGSAIFGIGWGVAGYCPGPVIASAGFGNPEALWFVPAMIAGIALQRHFFRGVSTQTNLADEPHIQRDSH